MPKRCTASCCAACNSCAPPTRAWSASPPAAPGWSSGCRRTWACAGAPGVISSAMHRDDFAKPRPGGASAQTQLPFDVNGADVVAARRRALHRPHHARGAQRAVRLRPAGLRPARGAGRPRRARAAGAADFAAAQARRCPPRNRLHSRATTKASSASKWRNRLMLYKRNPQLNKNGELVHLLSIEGLPKRHRHAHPRHRRQLRRA